MRFSWNMLLETLVFVVITAIAIYLHGGAMYHPLPLLEAGGPQRPHVCILQLTPSLASPRARCNCTPPPGWQMKGWQGWLTET